MPTVQRRLRRPTPGAPRESKQPDDQAISTRPAPPCRLLLHPDHVTGFVGPAARDDLRKHPPVQPWPLHSAIGEVSREQQSRSRSRASAAPPIRHQQGPRFRSRPDEITAGASHRTGRELAPRVPKPTVFGPGPRPLHRAISIGVDARVTPLHPRGNSKAIATDQRVP